MSLLYPVFLWLLLPLALLWQRGSKSLALRTHLLILALLLISLARPVQEGVVQAQPIEGREIIIALDLSYSMQATDIYPTRYAFAKESMHTLLERSQNDNIMLIAFTTNPLILSPPTTDHALLHVALETLNPDYILTKGTSLEHLFKKVASLKGGKKTLLLITDGGEEKHLEPLLELLKRSDISLITLAMGTEQGSTIQDKEGKLLKDKQGNLVITRINPLLLRLTTAMHGDYLTANQSSQSMGERLYTLLQQSEKTLYSHKKQRNYQEWYAVPLLLALLLFTLLHTRLFKYLLLLFTLLGIQAHASFLDTFYLHQAYQSYKEKAYIHTLKQLARIEDPSLQRSLLQADCYYQQHAYKKAIQLYQGIQSSSVSTKQHLYYNIATAYAQLHHYEKAKIYYSKVLQLGEDTDAFYNLKTIALLKERKENALGMAQPKSQSVSSGKNLSSTKERKRKEESTQKSAGAGAGSKTKKQHKITHLKTSEKPQKHPLSSKVYELINKGYIRETHPW